jgi:hypothetical protein
MFQYFLEFFVVNQIKKWQPRGLLIDVKISPTTQSEKSSEFFRVVQI